MTEAEITLVVTRVLKEQQARSNTDENILRTISTILTSFGIDEKERKEIKLDFSHLRRWRLASEQVTRVSVVTVVGIVVTGLAGMLWVGFKALVGK